MKKITKAQIDILYKFTRTHFVEHFDVQTELVDHLANDIENQWEENPNLSFEMAKQIAFKKFGVFGFMDVVAARQKALSKKYWKLIFNIAKDWFKLPKIIITSLLFIIIYTILKTSFAQELIYTLLVTSSLYFIWKSYLLKKQFKIRQKKINKKWMLEEMIYKIGMGTLFMLPVNMLNIIHLTNFEKIIINNSWAAYLYAITFTAFFLIFYIAIEVLPNKAETILKKQYPEYKLV